MKRFNLSAWAVSHPPLVLFLIVALGLFGFISYERLGRAEDPSFTVKVVNVSMIWPGATATEMQSQVADPIEKKLQELPYFEKVETYSKPAFAAMQITFRDSTPPKEVPYLFYLVRRKLADVQASLPSGVLGPFVNDEFSDVDSILFMMTGDGADYAQLKKVAEGLRQRLLKVDGVTKVNLYGTQDERIYVEFSHAKLATLGITPQALFDSLAKQNNVTSAGTVETSSQRVPLRVTGALDGAKAVAETPVESNGRVFRLGDIATVTHGFVDPPTYKVHQEGKPALGLGIVTAKGANILELGKDVHAASDDRRGAGHRAVRFVPGARLAHRHRGGAVGAAGARHRLHRDECNGTGSAPHLSRRADHRPRPPGGRRDHRGRDDGGEDGAGLGPRPRRIVRLGIHGLPDAHGNAGHRRRLPADRLRQFCGRRIHGNHLLDRRHLAGGVLVCRCHLHTLYRREAVAGHEGPSRSR